MTIKRSLRLWMVAFILLALMCPTALAKVVSPGKDFYYLDNANVLSEALEGEIFFSNKLLYDACGAQIVVVTVDSTGNEAIDDYAYDLFNSWGIGDAAKNNGFLLLLAIGDDDYYARTGSGLDSRFSASTIKEYYDRYLEADFAAKDYEAGVKKFFEAVFERIAVTYSAEVTTAQGIADYQAYLAQNAAADSYGGYNGTRRYGAENGDYRGYAQEDEGIGMGFVLFVLLVIVLIVLLSKGRRARRRARIIAPPPPPPVGFSMGYRPRRTLGSSFGFGGNVPPRSSSGWSSGSSRSSSGWSSGSSRSSSGWSSGSSRSSSSSSRSSGFGGSSGGGGRSSGGGAGRGRH